MLSYTFSRREKMLLLGAAIILVVVAWYALVYQNTTNMITHLESEISQVESDTTIASAKAAQMDYMQSVIDEQKAAGVQPKPVPEYDNIQPLMAFLDSVMSTSSSYDMSFEKLDLSDSSYVQRPVKISFKSSSYEATEGIVTALANGPYTCVIDSVSMSESTSSSGTGLIDSMIGNTRETVTVTTVSSVVHVIFYEKYPADGSLAPSSNSSKSTSGGSKGTSASSSSSSK